MDDFKRFQDVVEKYANAYADFESIQKPGKDRIDFVPEKGDQKTGVIGEAYIYKYLKEKGCKNLEFGDPSQKSWDIKYTEEGKEKTVQVKTVSEFSECQIISEIIPGFDILYLVKLNKQLYPTKILKVTTKGDWPDIRHKAFPKDKFSYKNCIFQTFDETEDFMKILQLKSN